MVESAVTVALRTFLEELFDPYSTRTSVFENLSPCTFVKYKVSMLEEILVTTNLAPAPLKTCESSLSTVRTSPT